MAWGYLRESAAAAKKAGDDPDTGVCRTGLEQYLSVIFPEVTDWIYDKSIGSDAEGRARRIRPDYRSDTLRLIVELDGLPHYQNPLKIRSDRENQRVYEQLGYTVVRIPYFIQLTNRAVEVLFNRRISFQLFNPDMPSMGPKAQNTPAFICLAGLTRMAEEFVKFPEQYEVNLRALKHIDDEFVSGADALEREYRRILVLEGAIDPGTNDKDCSLNP